MSRLSTIVRRLVSSILTTPRASTDPDTMALRDWADLPAHHPLS
ncbi:hypothetical protein [Devosia sp. SL43]|jgi:hypothetical protein|nr:hypothetical protein [Devosia sp. SL43]